MSDSTQMLDVIKRAALEVTEAGKPFALTYGEVRSIAPLTIWVEQKLELGPSQLLLTSAVRDYTVDMSVDHWTEDETEHTHTVGGEVTTPSEHRHAYRGRKNYRVHNGLQVGERVMLLRVQGGQKYIVLDRVED